MNLWKVLAVQILLFGFGYCQTACSCLTELQLQKETEYLSSLDTSSIALGLNLENKPFGINKLILDRVHHSYPTLQAMNSLLDDLDNNANFRTSMNTFLTELMKTPVMQELESFIHSQGDISRGSLKSVLEDIWFSTYDRSSCKGKSSGFRHVFYGEKDKSCKYVAGFHNWVNFERQENSGKLEYLGSKKKLSLGNKGDVMTVKFKWNGAVKKYGSIFLGTSPELQMAIYTLCFYARRGDQCPVWINGKKFLVKTYEWKNQGLISSAYPIISELRVGAWGPPMVNSTPLPTSYVSLVFCSFILSLLSFRNTSIVYIIF